MKFALVDNLKTEATKGARGICQSCGSELIAKCGPIKIDHWAHKGKRKCDHWWENETEWHRSWKNHFPLEWQEVVQFDENGEKHIADVKTKFSWVLEFQHSFIKDEERNARNTFYPKLVWVVDGLRRKKDLLQFQRIIGYSSTAPIKNVNIRQVNLPSESRLLNEWSSCGVPVFFDFQELFFDFQESNESGLWFLLPIFSKEKAYLINFSRSEFINVHNNSGFDELINEIIPNIRNILIDSERISTYRSANPILQGAYRKRKRRRF